MQATAKNIPAIVRHGEPQRGGAVAKPIAPAYVKQGGITASQEAELWRLGHIGHLPWFADEAARLIAKLKRERKAIEEQGIVTLWEKGENCLNQGYVVEPMEEPYCYRVHRPSQQEATAPDGKATCYHVCLDPSIPLPGCDCPDYGQRGEQRDCKHMATARVSLWHGAQDTGEPERYAAYLTRCGAIQLRQSFEAAKGAKK